MKLVAALAILLLALSATGDTTQNYPISELYVMSMDSAELIDGQRLVLDGVNRKVIWFTDRPDRGSGVADVRIFIANWPAGTDSFEVDPPNAVIVGALKDGTEIELPLELTEPSWSDDSLVLSVLPLNEPLPNRLSLTNAHLFIDNSGDDDGDATGWCGHACFKPVIGTSRVNGLSADSAESPQVSRE
ncbi:MAG: hypothetical protein AAF699_14945 [Pseudomonadota bacterium]